MHLRAVNMHAELQLLAHSLDVFEAFLVIWSGAAHPDLDLVLDERGGDFANSADDALECGRDLVRMSAYPVLCEYGGRARTYVCKVRDTAADE